jgi:acyl-CoA synthetase (NDP forming)
VAIVTHSGSVGGLVFSSLQLAGIGIDYWLGLGNEATLETADFIAHFNADPSVHTVICYLEGVRSGRKFIEAAAEARRRGTRIVALRAGRHPVSARSTASHTGMLPTRADVYAGVFRQLGVIEVTSLAALTYAMALLTTLGTRLGPRIGILSASGGACSLLADHVVAAGLALPELPLALQERLNRVIPEYGSSLNPVDLSADVVSRAEILHGTLAELRAEAGIDVWLVFGRPIVDRYCRELVEFARDSGKALIVSCGVPLQAEVRETLRASRIAVLDDPALCLTALGCIWRARRAKDVGPAQAQVRGREAALTPIQQESDVAPAHARPQEAAPIAASDLNAAAAAPDATVRIAIENDRDFGPVVALEIARARIVRALPASAEDLRDAAAELCALDPRFDASTARIVAALERLIAATPEGRESHAAIGVGA